MSRNGADREVRCAKSGQLMAAGLGICFIARPKAGITEEIPHESDANENQAELSLSQSKARYVGTKAFRG